MATAYELRSGVDLERASRVPGASAIAEIDGPGGSQRVMLTDLDGNDRLDTSVPKGVTALDDMHAPWGPNTPHDFIAQRSLRTPAAKS